MPAVAKACDACNIRRIKCAGGNPCIRCRKSDIRCTYDRPSLRKGPAGKTVGRLRQTFGTAESAHVLGLSRNAPDPPSLEWSNPDAMDEIFNQLSNGTAVSLKARWNASELAAYNGASSGDGSDGDSVIGRSPRFPHSPTVLSELSGLFANSKTGKVHRPFGQPVHAKAQLLDLLDPLLTSCIDTFMSRLHGLNPFIDTVVFHQKLEHRYHLHEPQFAALILSMSAMVLSVPAAMPQGSDKSVALLEHALSLHNTTDLGASPTLQDAATSMMIAVVLMVHKGYKASYLRHRETLALMELMQLTRAAGYEQLSEGEKHLAMRMMCILVCIDRSHALLQRRSALLKLDTSLGELRDQIFPQSELSKRIERCHAIFDVVEPALVDCINGHCLSHLGKCKMTLASILSAQATLRNAEPIPSQSPVQLADQVLTREWLHVKVWQACVTHSLLMPEGQAGFEELTIGYPIARLHKVHELLKKLPLTSVLGNGQAMGRKLNQVVEVAGAVINLPIPPMMPSGIGSVDDARRILTQVKATVDKVSDQAWMRYEGDDVSEFEAIQVPKFAF